MPLANCTTIFRFSGRITRCREPSVVASGVRDYRDRVITRVGHVDSTGDRVHGEIIWLWADGDGGDHGVGGAVDDRHGVAAVVGHIDAVPGGVNADLDRSDPNMDRRGDSVAGAADDRDRTVTDVGHVDAVGGRVHINTARLVADRHRRHDSVGGAIDDRHGVVETVGHVDAVGSWIDRDAIVGITGTVDGDGCDGGAGCGISHRHELRVVADDIEAVGTYVDCDTVDNTRSWRRAVAENGVRASIDDADLARELLAHIDAVPERIGREAGVEALGRDDTHDRVRSATDYRERWGRILAYVDAVGPGVGGDDTASRWDGCDDGRLAGLRGSPRYGQQRRKRRCQHGEDHIAQVEWCASDEHCSLLTVRLSVRQVSSGRPGVGVRRPCRLADGNDPLACCLAFVHGQL